ncbi:hypothetical protein MSG28_012673 [Choristoneura fumiferana]|uniref:Uncharacterized protein n=1 Tax=Choristoneura fumiferana TaxID=7141 RepID=A0ACC0JIA9_CHOFU|nr:hypothetical protein MSG28_012673 [Choristoneura fumiferana]
METTGATPIKALPFSPSQFLNSPAALSFPPFDATPLSHQLHKVRTSGVELTFSTPTPFKIAMAEIGKKSGLNYEPSSPGLLVKDITEIIEREESDSTRRASEQGKENQPGASTTHKKARKALAHSWGAATSTPHARTVPDVAFIVETPVSTYLALNKASRLRARQGDQPSASTTHKKARKALAHSWGAATSTPHARTVPDVAFIVETPVSTYLALNKASRLRARQGDQPSASTTHKKARKALAHSWGAATSTPHARTVPDVAFIVETPVSTYLALNKASRLRARQGDQPSASTTHKKARKALAHSWGAATSTPHARTVPDVAFIVETPVSTYLALNKASRLRARQGDQPSASTTHKKARKALAHSWGAATSTPHARTVPDVAFIVETPVSTYLALNKASRLRARQGDQPSASTTHKKARKALAHSWGAATSTPHARTVPDVAFIVETPVSTYLALNKASRLRARQGDQPSASTTHKKARKALAHSWGAATSTPHARTVPDVAFIVETPVSTYLALNKASRLRARQGDQPSASTTHKKARKALAHSWGAATSTPHARTVPDVAFIVETPVSTYLALNKASRLRARQGDQPSASTTHKKARKALAHSWGAATSTPHARTVPDVAFIVETPVSTYLALNKASRLRARQGDQPSASTTHKKARKALAHSWGAATSTPHARTVPDVAFIVETPVSTYLALNKASRLRARQGDQPSASTTHKKARKALAHSWGAATSTPHARTVPDVAFIVETPVSTYLALNKASRLRARQGDQPSASTTHKKARKALAHSWGAATSTPHARTVPDVAFIVETPVSTYLALNKASRLRARQGDQPSASTTHKKARKALAHSWGAATSTPHARTVPDVAFIVETPVSTYLALNKASRLRARQGDQPSASTTHKKARKALAHSWGAATSTPHARTVPDVAFIVETPVSTYLALNKASRLRARQGDQPSASTTHKKARKALAHSWGAATSTPHARTVPDVAFIVETPVSTYLALNKASRLRARQGDQPSASTTHKKARKALAHSWGAATSTPHARTVPDVAFIVETPVSTYLALNKASRLRARQGDQPSASTTHKKARKALAHSWGAATSTPHARTVPDVAFIVETPVSTYLALNKASRLRARQGDQPSASTTHKKARKALAPREECPRRRSKTLAGDSSVMFSPPSIVKNSLAEESTSLHSLMSENTPETIKYEDLDIEAAITEKTKIRLPADEPVVLKKSAVRSIKFEREPDVKDEPVDFILGQGGYEHNIINDDRGRLAAQAYGTRVLGPTRDSTHLGSKLTWQDSNSMASIDASKRLGGRARTVRKTRARRLNNKKYYIDTQSMATASVVFDIKFYSWQLLMAAKKVRNLPEGVVQAATSGVKVGQIGDVRHGPGDERVGAQLVVLRVDKAESSGGGQLVAQAWDVLAAQASFWSAPIGNRLARCSTGRCVGAARRGMTSLAPAWREVPARRARAAGRLRMAPALLSARRPYGAQELARVGVAGETAAGLENIFTYGAVDYLANTGAELKAELNDRDQDLLLGDLEISGIPEAASENGSHLVGLVARSLGVVLDERDIVFAARVGAPRRSRDVAEGGGAAGDAGVSVERVRLRPLFVRLARRAPRPTCCAARVRRGADTSDFGLPGSPTRSYANERLTRLNRSLFYSTR